VSEALTEALVVSNLVLWVLVVALGLVVVALTRQIGVLHERIAPAGALAVDQGPGVGEAVATLEAPALDGTRIAIGGKTGQRMLIFFLSPTCPVCKTLLPTLAWVAREQGPDPVRVVYASDGEPAEHLDFARRHSLPAADYALSMDLGLRFAVSKLPYAVLVDAAGVLRAKGIVNTREHLESLFEAEALGVSSLQEHAREQASLELVDGGASR
jgi:methylamine dehydrogenase accessory protein MauD